MHALSDNRSDRGDQASPTRPTPPRADAYMPWVVLVIGTIASLTLAFWVFTDTRGERVSSFENQASLHLQQLRNDLERSIESLRPLGMLFASSHLVERGEFRTFATELLSRDKTLEAVAWIPHITEAERSQFEAALRQDNPELSGITEADAQLRYNRAATRTDYFPIQYIEPYATYKVIAGSDLGAVRRPEHALIRAMGGEDPTVSIPMNFAQIPEKPLCVMVFMRPAGSSDPEAPPAATDGVVMGAFRIEALLAQSTHNARDYGLAIRVNDEQLDVRGSPSFFSTVPDRLTKMTADLTFRDRIRLGGRSWVVEISKTQPPWSALRLVPACIAIGGIAASVMLAAFLSSRIGRRHAKLDVEYLTHNLSQANTTLLTSQQRLQSLFDHSIDPLWDWDADADKTHHSRSWPTILGYAPDSIDPDAVSWSDRLHPEDKPRVWSAIEQCLRGETDAYEAQYRLRHENKGWIRVYSRGSVVERHPDGRLKRMIGNMTDMTSIFDAQDALRESEARFRQVADHISEIVWLDDWNTKETLYINSAYERVWGLPLTSTLGLRNDAHLMVHPEDVSKVERVLAERKSTGRSDQEYRIIRADGQVRWIHSRVVPIYDEDGAIVRTAGVATDVTERKTTELALRDSEERLRQITDNIDSVFWMNVLDPMRIVYISPAFERIWGRPTTDFTEQRVAWIDTIHPADRAMAQTAFRTWLDRRGEGAYDIVYRVLRPDNTIRWIRDRGFAVRNEHGEVYRLAGFAEDVTAQVQAETALERSQQRLGVLIEQAAVGIAEVDLQGRFRLVNRRLCDILGYTQEDLTSRTFAQITHPDDIARNLNQFNGMMEGRYNGYSIQKRYIRADGGICTCNLAVAMVRDEGGKPVSVISVVEDITARLAAEAIARETTERHRLALEAVAGVVYDFDVLSGKTTRSIGLERLLGYSPDELAQGVDAWHSLIHPEDRDRAVSSVRNAIRTDPAFEVEYRMIHKDGHAVHVLDKGIVQRNSDGSPTRVVGCAVDVSSVNEARRALRASEDRNRAILSAVPDHLFHVDREGRYLAFHSNSPQELLVPPERFMRRTISEVIPTELANRSMQALEQVFQTGEPQSFEFRRDHGHRVSYTEFRVVPAGANEALILVRDISERKQAEQRLRESEERYRDLFELIPEAIMLHSGSSIAMGNRAAALLMGVDSPHDLAGAHFFDSMPEADRAASMRFVREIEDQTARSHTWQAHVRHPSGAIRTVEIAASRVSIEGRPTLLTIARDLTERLRSEERLAEVHERLTSVLERLPDVVAYDDAPDGLYVGNTAINLLGYPAERLMREPDLFRSLVHPEDAEHVERRRRRFLSSPVGSHHTLQFRMRHADGRDVWVEDRMILTSKGDKRRMVGVLIDITQIKDAESALRGMMAERDHRVKNNLASVLAIADHSIRRATDLSQFREEFIQRVKALASVHTALAQSRWKHVEMRSMIHDTLAPYQSNDEARVVLEGKPTVLPGRVGPPLALMLHELATNAAKHGALSCAAGQVHVQWDLHAGPNEHVLRFRWKEKGGPTVSPPTRRGFGRDLIESGLRHELGATVQMHFNPDGLDCVIEVPIRPDDRETDAGMPSSSMN